ncbi:triose-phosphate isomerase [Marinobacterium jannaschii]|uniref:triose-phosphate isomerase n=1 Tax=Marinobacterium jannaschii TaxID=64970 RepID=UPI000486ACAA|nr:triose-phosphate isomerase [Marinobacterium jannaschii]
MRKPIVAGNWKMNGDKAFVSEIISQFVAEKDAQSGIEVFICPPAVYLAQAAEAVADSAIALGAQNVSQFVSGAYTGEVSVDMLSDLGCRYVLLGHSERRALFAEDDQAVAEKFVAVSGSPVIPVLCIGETLEEREAGKTLEVVSRQLKAVLDKAGVESFLNAVVAYEPVWAIGTGKTATPEQAQEVHAAVRAVVAEYSSEIAEGLRLLYGGSVNAANAEELFAQPDVDGGLVGGASLKANDFIAICRAAAGA